MLLRKTFFVALVAMTVGTPAVMAANARDDSVKRATSWVLARQRSNGAFFDDSQPANGTGETLAALIAGGATGEPVTRALGYIKAHGSADANQGAYTARMISGIVAGGGDPRHFGGVDYVSILGSQYDVSTGSYDSSNFFADLIGANGVLAPGGTLPAKAIEYIRSGQCSDGGFAAFAGCDHGSDVDTTAWAINVIAASQGRTDSLVTAGRSYLLSVQKPDGGFAFIPTQTTSSDSTGLALAAIAAMGDKATSSPWRQSDGDDPVDALIHLQESSGGFKPNAGGKASGGATVNSIPGLAKKSYPIPSKASSAPERTSTPVRTQAPPKTDGAESADATATPAGAYPTATVIARGSNAVRHRSDHSAPGTSTLTPIPGTTPQTTETVRVAAPFAGATRSSSDRTSGGFPVLAWIGIGIGFAGTGSAIGLRFIRLHRR